MFESACLRGVELIKGNLTGIVFGENDEKPKVYYFLPWSRMNRISLKIVIISQFTHHKTFLFHLTLNGARLDERVLHAIHKRPGSRSKVTRKSQKIFSLESTRTEEPLTTSHH